MKIMKLFSNSFSLFLPLGGLGSVCNADNEEKVEGKKQHTINESSLNLFCHFNLFRLPSFLSIPALSSATLTHSTRESPAPIQSTLPSPLNHYLNSIPLTTTYFFIRSSYFIHKWEWNKKATLVAHSFNSFTHPEQRPPQHPSL